MATDPLKTSTIVIIGGTSGIGFAIAESALAVGARVIVASSQGGKVDAAVTRLGAGATGVVIDVRDEARVAARFEEIGLFDHLVFTAGDWGGPRGAELGQLDLGAAAKLFEVRFWGAARAVKHAQRRISPTGSITLTDGMIAHRPRKGSALSTAMAGAIEHLTAGLAVELAPLRVNAVCPGLVRTEVWNSLAEDGREEQFRQMTKRQLVARIGEPDEVAQAYLYLMRCGYTTGQVLRVDGGGSLV